MKSICVLIFVLLLSIAPSAHALEPNDPLLDQQWYLEHIGAYGAWEQTTGSPAVTVAVLDSGVDLDHPDLVQNIWHNPGEIAGNGVDDDGNGYIDDVFGWDFVEGDNLPTPSVNGNADPDAISHGSLISGVIGAVGNNGQGVAGVNWDVRVMPLRVLNEDGAGSSFDVALAIDYAVANGADVINLSFSGDESQSFLANAVRHAYESGVVIVAALGNEGQNTNDASVYPGCYESMQDDWVIGVASTDREDRKTAFTNFGASCTDLSAPGVDIFGLNYEDPPRFPDAYAGGWSGTSTSAPLVAGTAALLLAEYPDLEPEEIETILELSVDPVNPASEDRDQLGAGRLNIARAIEFGANFSSSSAEVISHNYVSGASFPAVYHISGDVRRVFIDTNTYFTYEDAFDAVTTIADTELSDYSIGGLMLPKPGVVLVKIQSDPRVYAIEANPSDPFTPILRAIDSESIALQMYGADWADFVIDIEPTHFSKFIVGQPILSPEPVDTSIMKTRQELAALAHDSV